MSLLTPAGHSFYRAVAGATGVLCTLVRHAGRDQPFTEACKDIPSLYEYTG